SGLASAAQASTVQGLACVRDASRARCSRLVAWNGLRRRAKRSALPRSRGTPVARVVVSFGVLGRGFFRGKGRGLLLAEVPHQWVVIVFHSRSPRRGDRRVHSLTVSRRAKTEGLGASRRRDASEGLHALGAAQRAAR